jgi:hypothetical protein
VLDQDRDERIHGLVNLIEQGAIGFRQRGVATVVFRLSQVRSRMRASSAAVAVSPFSDAVTAS